MLCSTAADSLKWYMTFLTRPEVLQLSSADINSMITPKLDRPFKFANGTYNPSTEDAKVFAQAMSTYGSPDTGHEVRLFRISDTVSSINACYTLDRSICQSVCTA